LYLYTDASWPAAKVFDSIPLYPASLVPAPLARTHAWYLSTFRDPLVGQQPPFFRFFTYAELLYQLPTAVYLVRALRRRSPTAPAHLLVWAVLAAFTTATCCWEIAASAQMTPAQKWTLGALYGSYGVFCEYYRSPPTPTDLAEWRERLMRGCA